MKKLPINRMLLAAMGLTVVGVARAQEADPVPADINPAGTEVEMKTANKKIVPVDNVATFYLVPMKGQMGTDIHLAAYEQIIEDIKAKNPDVLIFDLNSADIDKQEYIQQEDKAEAGLMLIEDYRDLVQVFRDRIPKNIRQVMWVEDSVGMASLVAMAWPEMYMKPGARLFGLSLLWQMSKNWADKDVRMKMMAAWTGIGKGFLQYGGHPNELGEAMMRPERLLSCSFVGRKVKWFMSDEGETVIDNSKEAVVSFNNKTAEEFEISQGTAETLEDLAFLLGYREFKVIQGLEDSPALKYKEDWRRLYDRCVEWFGDYQTAMKRANGDDAAKWLGVGKNRLEDILSAMERFKAIENRMAPMGISKAAIQSMIDDIKERILEIKKMEKGSRNRGGSGSGGGSGGGPKTF